MAHVYLISMGLRDWETNIGRILTEPSADSAANPESGGAAGEGPGPHFATFECKFAANRECTEFSPTENYKLASDRESGSSASVHVVEYAPGLAPQT